MSETQLPPVAKSFFTFCSSCNADRYHTVLTHTSATAAKLQCEVCKSKSTYKLPSAKKAKKASTGGGKEASIRALTGAAAKRKEAAASAKRSAHVNEYNELVDKSAGEASNYNMKLKFEMNSKIQHPKFGLGVVEAVQAEKIEVIFEDQIRNLVHNRG